MALYRIYIDEVGAHDLTHADDPNQRFLSLTGVILESDYTLRVLQPEMDHLKREFFQRDPDVPVIFHRKEMVNKPKSANIAGLQLADLIAHPSRREVLIEHQLIVDDRDIFGSQICAILCQSKYNRERLTGQIEGYGKKLLP
jgi:hypothetical protein